MVMALMLTSIAVPLASASSLTVHVYPNQNKAEVTAVSDTKIVFTYPNNSTVSNWLMQNVQNESYTMYVNISYGQSPIAFFEGFLRSHYANISVDNMSVALHLNLVRNSTQLVINKNMNIVIWVSGIFNKSKNGTTIANMSWRDFAVNGQFEVNYHGTNMDINEVGGVMPNMGYLMYTSNTEYSKYSDFADRATINYSSLSAPLTHWNRVYSSSLNSTDFTYIYNRTISYNASFSINGQNYTLNMSYDPSASIVVPGYATASDNNLIISSTAPNTAFPYLLAGIAAVVVIVIVLAAAMLIRSRNLKK